MMISWRKRMFGTDYDIGCSEWKVATKRQNAKRIEQTKIDLLDLEKEMRDKRESEGR